MTLREINLDELSEHAGPVCNLFAAHYLASQTPLMKVLVGLD
jgi:hypothetical protein